LRSSAGGTCSSKPADLLIDEGTIAAEKPAPATFVILGKVHSILYDGPIREWLSEADQGSVVRLTGDLPDPTPMHSIHDLNDAGSTGSKIILVPADNGRPRDDGLSIRMEPVIERVEVSFDLLSGEPPSRGCGILPWPRRDIITNLASADSVDAASGTAAVGVLRAGPAFVLAAIGRPVLGNTVAFTRVDQTKIA